MRAILVDSLKFKYSQSNKFAVDDVSFEINKGSYTAIVGLNGSGKSTLARLLCGLEEPVSGSITIEENPQIGIIFQSPKDQIVSGLVYRDTEFGPLNLHLTPAEAELRAIESLNIVDMLDRAESSTSALSLGQTQKIALSGVIAMHPQILILDEAIAMLDPVSRTDILEFLKYWHKCGNTIIHITHDVDAIKEAQHIIGMEAGHIYFDGTKESFFENTDFVHKIEGDSLPVTDKQLLNNREDLEASLYVENLSFEYDKVHGRGVHNISFNLFKGTVTALTGPSGAGKSTLMELCSGLQKPGDGEIFVSGNILERPALAQQNAQAALFETFAADDVAFGARNKGVTGQELLSLVKNSMDSAYLPFEDFSERNTFKLSGGEQRRLSIAGILAVNSNVVFFDEPTAGLDSAGRIKVLNMFRDLANQGKTVLFSTHKNDEADFADREIRIEEGTLVKDTFAGENPVKKETVEVTPYEGVKMLSGLDSAATKLAGTGKKNKNLMKKIPAALRILLFLALFIVSICLNTTLWCSGMLVAVAIYAVLSGFKLKNYLKTCCKILPFLLIFAAFQMVFHPPLIGEKLLFEWKWLVISWSKIIHCCNTMLRTFAAIGCICGFYISTPEYDLIDGLKVLLKPLEKIKVPVRYFILIMELIFRFIPLLVEVTICIIKTQLIRGGLGKTKGKLAKIKAMMPLFVPMIIQTIKRSEVLADAITVRAFK